MTWPHPRRFVHLAWLFATVALASCAQRPPVRDVDDAARQWRAEYLLANPAGQFNRNIECGEVALGMRFDDVVASWGVPDARERTGDGTHERWTYTSADGYNGDWVRYDLFFEKRALSSWETMRCIASSHPISGTVPGAGAPAAVPGGASGLVTSGVPRR